MATPNPALRRLKVERRQVHKPAQNRGPLAIAISALTEIQALCARGVAHDVIWKAAEAAIYNVTGRH